MPYESLRLFALPFALMIAMDLQTPAPRPTGSARQQIVGTWQLMTRTVQRADRTTIVDPVLGEKPMGRLVYDATGHMMLQMMRMGRKDAGRYTLDEKAGTVDRKSVV